MIVDDSRMIVGSANINDRSLVGNHDSELATYIHGPLNAEVRLCDGTVFEVNKDIFELRTKLFEDHFGLLSDDTIAPHTEFCWKHCWNIMKINTQAYDEIFHCYPSNKFKNFHALMNAKKMFDDQAFEEIRDLIQGTAIEYCYSFLIDENLENAKQEDLGLMVMPKKAFF